jgi:hypothetical protein
LGSNTTGDYNTAIGRNSLGTSATASYNTAVGAISLFSNTTGYNNTAIGYVSLAFNTTGYNNTANGYAALYSNTIGYLNTANGYAALYTNSTGYQNTANAALALYLNTTGYNNTANGYASLYSNTTGFYNTAVGWASLYSNTVGFYNTAVGWSSLYSNTTGYNNTAIGVQALLTNITGRDNTANGYAALYTNSTGVTNTAIGSNTLFSNTTGSQNTAIGHTSIFYNTTGSRNTAVGLSSLFNNRIGSRNTAVGYNSLQSNSIGGSNVAIGDFALYSQSSGVVLDTTGFTPGSGYVGGEYYDVELQWLSGSSTFTSAPTVYIEVDGSGVITYVELTTPGSGFLDTTTVFTVNNGDLGGTGAGFEIGIISLISIDGSVAVGTSALELNTTGNYNTAIGHETLKFNTLGSNNTAIGYQSLFNTTGFANTAVGYRSLYSNTGGVYNTAIGYQSLYSNTIGNNNIALGFNSLYTNSTGYQNVALGYLSLYFNTNGYQNTAIGILSLYNNTTGNNNIAIGQYSLRNNSTGSLNTALGLQSLHNNTTGNNNIALGQNSLFSNTTAYGSVALGQNSLQYNSIGDRNTSVGISSLRYYTGFWSVGLGGYALSSASTGILTLSATFSPGSGYTPGTYTDVRLQWSGGGTFWSAPSNDAGEYPTATIVVGAGGTVSSVTLKRRGVLLTSTTTRFNAVPGPFSWSLGPSGGSGFSIGIGTIATADMNTALGYGALGNIGVGSNNIGVGMWAGLYYGTSNIDLTGADNSIFIGRFTSSLNNNTINEIVIGNEALGNGPNSITLGNDLATKTILKGDVGIGLTGPSTNLHIYSTSSAFRLEDGSQGAGKVLVSDANGLATWSSVGSGSSGSSGTSGIAGNDSSNSGRWLLNSTSSTGNPNVTKFNTNSSSVGSITTIVISSTSLTGVSDDYIAWLSSIETIVANGNSAIIQLVEVGSNNIIGLYDITSIISSILGGWFTTFTVSYLAGAGTITAGKNYTISWNYSGKPLPVGSELVYAELYAASSFSNTLGTGSGAKPWVAISNGFNLIDGEVSSDVTYDGLDTLTIDSKDSDIYYQFVITLACFKGEATGNGIEIGVSIDGVDPVVGMLTTISTPSFTTTPRELSVTGIFSLSALSSHTVRMMVRQSGGGGIGTNTITFASINFNIRSINALIEGPVGPVGPGGSSGTSGTSGTSGDVIYRFGSGPISPANSGGVIYYIGTLTDLSATVTNFVFRQSISQFTGSITEVSILRYPSGLAGTGEFSTFNMINVTQGTSRVISNTVTTNSGSGLIDNYVLSTPLAVTTGDFLQITWVTPVWVTAPTSVRILAHVKIRY